jgi:fructose-bisphosphate aldolase, class I
MIDISHLTTNGRALYLAYDQGMELGPSLFNTRNIDPNFILDVAVQGGVNGVILQRGIAERYYTGTEYQQKVPLIMKLNGKTAYITEEPYAPLLCTVQDAIELGASAVGYTVYVGSKRQDEGFAEFAEVVWEAHQEGIPVFGWMYPKGGYVGEETPEINAYAARCGLEMGADVIKVHNVGNAQEKAWTVQCAGNAKVVFAGGKRGEDEVTIQTARDVAAAGGLGMACGRNIWMNDNPVAFIEQLKQALFA